MVKLEQAHEKILLEALMGMVTHGISYSGFVVAPPSAGKKGGKKQVGKGVPVEVKGKPEAA